MKLRSFRCCLMLSIVLALGAGALTELVRAIRDGRSSDRGATLLRLEPTRLIVRRSCGCAGPVARAASPSGDGMRALAGAMAGAAFGEARTSSLEVLQ